MDHPEDLTPEELSSLADDLTDPSKLSQGELKALLQRRLERLRQERRKVSDQLQTLDPTTEAYQGLVNYLEEESQKHREIEAQLAQLQTRQTGITSITIQNFKGISDPVTIPLRPITLLFGANSAGKSTILQAIHYVRELLERNNANPDQTLQGGDAIEFGGFRNLVYKHELEREIRIRLEIAPDDDGIPMLEEIAQRSDIIPEGSAQETLNINPQAKTVTLELAARWDFSRQKGWFSESKYYVNGQAVVTIAKAKPESVPVIEEINYFHPALLALDESMGDLKKEFDRDIERFREKSLFNLLGSPDLISDNKPPQFAFDLIQSETKAVIIKTGELVDRDTISRLISNLPNIICAKSTEELLPDGYIWIEAIIKQFQDKEREALKSCGIYPLIQLNGLISPVPSLVRPLPFSPSALTEEGQPYWSVINQIVTGITALARQYLEGFRYIGPIRAIPDRDHKCPQVEDPSRWANGLGAWDSLLRHYDFKLGNGDAFVENVSKWFSDPERLCLGYSIEVAGLRLVAEDSLLMNHLKLLQSQYDEHSQREFREKVLKPLQFEHQTPRVRIVDTRTGTEVGPKDIGIGVAQALPIVVGALDSKCPFLAVEQPELHLHPSAQARLGDLFVSQFKKERSFLIETHSETLMLRIFRRIRETKRKILPRPELEISKDDIALLFVSANEGGTRINLIRLDDQGKFVDPVPGGFFEEGFEELF